MHLVSCFIFAAILKTSLICACGGPRRFFGFLKDCFTVMEDRWTWTTREGEGFEDAEIEAIEENELILKHRHGVARLTIDALSEKSRHLLYHTSKWADHVAAQAPELRHAA